MLRYALSKASFVVVPGYSIVRLCEAESILHAAYWLLGSFIGRWL